MMLVPNSFVKNIQVQFLPGKISSLDCCQGQFQFGLSTVHVPVIHRRLVAGVALTRILACPEKGDYS